MADVQSVPQAAPRVSVVMPCRNEEGFIGAALRSLLDGEDPVGGLEVLVVDGASSDHTRLVVEGIANADRRVKLIDNPRGTTPAALNAGIRAARGDVVV